MRIDKARLRKAGFTLIELMIAVGIIGILSSTAIPNYRHLTAVIRAKACVTHVAEMRNILRVWYNEHEQSFPVTAGFNLITGNFPTPPVCPESGVGYTYASDGSTFYTLSCTTQPHPPPYRGVTIVHQPGDPTKPDKVYYDWPSTALFL